MADPNYSSKAFVYTSHGLSARIAKDRVPEGFYIDALNLFEREENTFSSRYGSLILNRDPDGSPSGASNYWFSSPVTSLARLLFQGQASRIAGLADGTLWQGPGFGQGEYRQIYSGLSGKLFQSFVASCYETAQPYLFIADAAMSIKVGTETQPATPQLWGIDPPPYTANSQPYSPLLTLIDGFSASNSYAVSNISGWSYSPVATLQPYIGSMVTDFPQFFQTELSVDGGTTTATSVDGEEATETAIYSGFSSDAIEGMAELVVPLSGSVSDVSGPASGSGTLNLYVSIDGGSTWTTLFSWISAAPGTLANTNVSASIYVGDTANVQIKVVVTADSGLTSTIAASATVGTISLSPINGNAVTLVADGMLADLDSGSTANVAVETIYASQETLSFNSSQYEYNSGLLRTKGGIPGGVLTDFVIATGFGFGIIPADATIDGLTLTLSWEGQGGGTGILESMGLFYEGSASGSFVSPEIINTNTFTNATYGSASETWGWAPGTLTTAVLQSSSFGFGTQVETIDNGSTRSFLNSFTIKVNYTQGGGTPSGSVSAIPIASIVSSGYDSGTGLYTTLTIATAAPHGLTGSPSVSVYGTSNDLADGFYTGTVIDASTLTVPFLSPVALSSQGGTLWSVSGGPPQYCALENIYTNPYPTQFSAWGFYASVPISVTQFPVGSWAGTVATNTTGTVGNTESIDLSQGNQVTDFDLLVLTLQVGSPANIASIQLQFDVNFSGYTSSYYTATLSPAYYQGSLVGQLSAYNATQNQVLADALGLLTGQQPTGSTTAQLSPSNFSTGSDAWTAVYIPRGNFLPVGNAGQSGLDWGAVTGWRLVIETTATAVTGSGSSTVGVNGLYLQWGYGPSSFAGIGYDWRYTYFDANTGTESSPSSEQFFNQQFGYLSSLTAPFYLRQAAQVTGQYSSDPQVTHLRMYRRGGIYGSNWLLIDQPVNLTAQGQFLYKDVIGDASLAQAQPLALDNDPPVTSSLVTPIQTTLAEATSAPGQSFYSTYAPQVVQVSDADAAFVAEQVVVVGNANNLEVVLVVQGGTGQFSAVLRLQHNAGEQVSATSIPRQACSLCALSNQGGITQAWMAGDPNNPHYLYYSKPGLLENFSPAGYIAVSAPDDPIMAVINWRGTIVVGTTKTWYTVIGGSKPYPQPSGAAHGMASSSWTLVEGRIIYLSQDGLRAFSGADGEYMTLPVEWMFRESPATIVPKLNASEYSQGVLAMYQNQAYFSFISASDYGGGQRYRLRFDDVYRRFGYDDVPATAMLWEQDTNAFLVGRQIGSNYAIVQDWVGDYDDGGWNDDGTALIQTPIDLTIWTPYRDLGKPHFPKQWNVLEGDYNTKNQPIQTTLYFKGEQEFSLDLPAMNLGDSRSKYQYQIPASSSASDPVASGVQAYSMSIQHRMSVTVAPELFQENIYAVMLADYRTSFDTYWQLFEGDYLGIFPKNIYCDYTATAQIVVQVFADGIMVPYYQDSTTLIPQSNRSVVRVQLPARKGRLWRVVMTCTEPFQLWAPVRTDTKPLCEGSGYAQKGFPVYE